MKFATINFYVGNQRAERDIELIDKLNLDVAGLQEAWRHATLIDKRLRDHKLYNARRSNSQASSEVSVILNKRNTELSYFGYKVSEVTPENETKIFKDRWVTVVRFKSGTKKYALINYHGNAVVQSKKTGDLLNNNRTSEWIKASRRIEKQIKDLSGSHIVLVTGDWNYRNFKGIKGFVLSYWSPQRIFKRTGLDWFERGLDYIAWSKSEKRVGPVQVIGTDKTGSDHPWLVVELA